MIKVDQIRARARTTPGFRRAALGLVLVIVAGWFLSITPTTTQAAGKVPVIIIPGVAGSTFTTGPAYSFSEPNNGHGGSYSHNYGSNENVWVNVWEAALPGSDDYFDTLRIGPDGDTPVVPYTQLAVSGLYSAYDDLKDYLHRQGYVDNSTLFTLAYDWRRDIPNATMAKLDALVNQARAQAGTSQVDIVGHSMGGLVARNYLSANAATAAKVRRLITLGTPYLGSPKFLKSLLYGDQFGPSFLGLGLDPAEVQDLVQNMAGGWELLPTRAYYNFYDNSNGNLLSPYREDRDVDGDGQARGVVDYNGLMTILRNQGRNQNAATFARDFHDRLDTNWPGSHPRLSFIDGSGLSTLGQVRDYTGSCWSWFHYVPCAKTDLLNVDGDGTVPYYSATPMDSNRGLDYTGGASIHIVNREHAALVQYDRILGIYTGDGPALPILGQILNNQVDQIGGNFFAVAASEATNLAQAGSKPAPRKIGLTGYAIAITNGVEIEAFDASGHHTGKVAGSDHKYEQEIGGSSLEIAQDSQLLYLPEGGKYRLHLTASTNGSFDLKVRSLSGDIIKSTVVYLNVPIKPGDQAELTIGTNNLRLTGQQKPLEPTAVLNERASLDREGPTLKLTTPKVNGDRVRVAWEVKDDLAGLHLQQGLVDAGTPNEQTVQNGQQLRLAAGSHVLQVIAQDKAGNSTVQESRFEVK